MQVRRFFLKLESRDLGAHLARIAALDGCVCQMLNAVLRAQRVAPLPALLAQALAEIRRDEGGRVRVTRDLALKLDVSSELLRQVGAATRGAFDGLLVDYDSAFEDLAVDFASLHRRLRRDVD